LGRYIASCYFPKDIKCGILFRVMVSTILWNQIKIVIAVLQKIAVGLRAPWRDIIFGASMFIFNGLWPMTDKLWSIKYEQNSNLDLGAKWRCGQLHAPAALSPGIEPRYPLDGPKILSGSCGVKKISCPCRESKPGRIPTELPRLTESLNSQLKQGWYGEHAERKGRPSV
jgi:hypothetical protein